MEQEQLLTVCEIFRVLLRKDINLIMGKMLLPVSEYTPLLSAGTFLNSQKEPFLISQKLNFIESLILEKLELPAINFYDFLFSSLQTANVKKSQVYSLDLETPKIIDEAVLIIKNYLQLSLTSPEFFEDKNLVTRFSSLFPSLFPGDKTLESVKVALQVINELRDDVFTQEYFLNLDNPQKYIQLIILLFKNELDRLIVFNQAIFDYLDLFIHISQITEFKKTLFRNFQYEKFNTGRDFEMVTFLSLFIRKSILPNRQDPLLAEFEKMAVNRVKSCKTQNAYYKTCQVN